MAAAGAPVVDDAFGVLAHPVRRELLERGIDLLCATGHVLDLTPSGRGDWFSSLTYS